MIILQTERFNDFWKTEAFAHSKWAVIIFDNTVHSFIPRNIFARMLAALCDTSQIHLYGSTCSQHNHSSPVCTFDADLSNCRKSIWSPSPINLEGRKTMICDIMHQSMIKDHDRRESLYWKLSDITHQINHKIMCISKYYSIVTRWTYNLLFFLCTKWYI